MNDYLSEQIRNELKQEPKHMRNLLEAIPANQNAIYRRLRIMKDRGIVELEGYTKSATWRLK